MKKEENGLISWVKKNAVKASVSAMAIVTMAASTGCASVGEGYGPEYKIIKIKAKNMHLYQDPNGNIYQSRPRRNDKLYQSNEEIRRYNNDSSGSYYYNSTNTNVNSRGFKTSHRGNGKVFGSQGLYILGYRIY